MDAAHRKLLARYQQRFGDPAGALLVRAPGRVNLLGDHTDYNDGLVLPITLDRSVSLALHPRDDRTVRLFSLNFDEGVSYRLGERPAGDIGPQRGSWVRYVEGVVAELHSAGLLPRGFEGAVIGDLPIGAGLSSSAALTVALALALQELFGFEMDALAMIRLCQRVEHDYAGVQCGVMDPYVSRLGRADHALLIDCRDMSAEHLPLPLSDPAAGVSLVLFHSGVQRELAGSRYNERRDECRQAVQYLRRFDDGIDSLRAVEPELLERYAGGMPGATAARARHVIGENRRVRAAAACLRDGIADDPALFGRLMNESHDSLRDLYRISCEELDELVRLAQQHEGVYGARMTGGGFGGCTVNLVDSAAAAALVARVESGFRRRFRRSPGSYVLRGNLTAGPFRPG